MLNKIILIGNVGSDVDVSTHGDFKVARLRLATSEKFKNKSTSEREERTEWHSISAFNKLADIVENYVKKGDLIYVEGKIKTSKYEKDGQERYSTAIIADQIKMLGGKQSKSGDDGQERSSALAKPEAHAASFDDEDIPF